jgi:hypothetical protein
MNIRNDEKSVGILDFSPAKSPSIVSLTDVTGSGEGHPEVHNRLY